MLSHIDKLLFHMFFAATAENPVLADSMILITNWSSRVFAVIYFAALAVLLLKKDKKIFPTLAGPAAAFILVQVIRYFYLRPRPFVSLEIESLINHAANSSLPSMHAAGAFVIATTIWFIDNRVGKIALVLAAVTAISRIMVGVHFPMDVLLGAALGVALGFTAFKIANKLVY